jgi:chromosome segregation ATPase
MSILDDKKISDANMDWFAFETRIRKVLHELLEPTAERSIKTKENMEEVKTQNDFLTRKVEELEFILHKSHKRSTLFDNVNKRLIESDSERKMLEVKMKNDYENLHTENSMLRDKINILDREIANLLSKINENTAEVTELKNSMESAKIQLSKDVANSKIEVDSKVDDTKTLILGIQDWQK